MLRALCGTLLSIRFFMIMIYNGKKVGHNGPEETIYIEQGVG